MEPNGAHVEDRPDGDAVVGVAEAVVALGVGVSDGEVVTLGEAEVAVAVGAGLSLEGTGLADGEVPPPPHAARAPTHSNDAMRIAVFIPRT